MSDGLDQSVTTMLAKDEGLIDLAGTALLIAEYLTHPFDKQLYLNRLDKMAAAIRSQLTPAQSATDIIDALNFYLFGQVNYTGNTNDYYNPDNSFLNRVMDGRTGIPLTLSMIYLEIGWRLRLPLWGIGLPGHFIVGYGAEADPIYIDVFHRGQRITEDDCLALSNTPSQRHDTFKRQFLRPVSKKAMLYRLLLNLKHIYLDQQKWPDALKTIDLMMILRPPEIGNLRDRGLIYYRLNRLSEAVTDLQRYIFLAPENRDIDAIKDHLKKIEAALLRLN
ncbi:MAG: tetratricopeptide repeat protein [Anaerolineaceae bacterium]|nr:tetratricopeptide repeat protein [Anaerolineaceae bacterium]MCB9099160.1 tetratricopeptide repeat protein [Anaerolineales bacterium]